MGKENKFHKNKKNSDFNNDGYRTKGPRYIQGLKNQNTGQYCKSKLRKKWENTKEEHKQLIIHSDRKIGGQKGECHKMNVIPFVWVLVYFLRSHFNLNDFHNIYFSLFFFSFMMYFYF